MMLLRELFRGFEEALDRGELVISSPDGVDGKHRAGRTQVDEPDASRKLLDQGADDKADTTAVCDVAPHGRAGPVMVDVGLETGLVAGGDDRLVVAGRHLVRPQLQGLVTHAGQLDLFSVGKTMILADGYAHDLAPDRLLADVL